MEPIISKKTEIEAQERSFKEIMKQIEELSNSYQAATNNPKPGTEGHPQVTEAQQSKNIQKIQELQREISHSQNLSKRAELRAEKLEEEVDRLRKQQVIYKSELTQNETEKQIMVSRIAWLNEKDFRSQHRSTYLKEILNQQFKDRVEEFDQKSRKTKLIDKLEAYDPETMKRVYQELRHKKVLLLNKDREISSYQFKVRSLESQVETWRTLTTKLKSIIKESLNPANSGIGKPLEPQINTRDIFKSILVEHANEIKSSSVSQPGRQAELSAAQKLLNTSLEQINKVLDREATLKTTIESLRSTVSEKEANHSQELSKLQKQHNESLKTISEISRLDVSSYQSVESLTQDDLDLLIRNFASLKSKYSKLKANLKDYTHKWAEDLKGLTDKEYEILKLKKIYKKLLGSYENLEKQLNAEKQNDESEAKIESLEKIIQNQALQIQNLLFQNHKLREYIQVKTGEKVPALDFTRSDFSQGLIIEEDSALYSSIESQTQQNLKLRQKLYLLTSEENQGSSNLSDGAVGAGNGVRMVQEGSKGSKGQDYNQLLIQYQNTKSQALELHKELSSWRETSQTLLNEKAELQANHRNQKDTLTENINLLEKKVSSYKEIRAELLAKITALSSQNSTLELDLVTKKSQIAKLEEKIKVFESLNQSKEKIIKQMGDFKTDVDQVWDKVEISIFDGVPEGDITAVLKANRDEVKGLIDDFKRDFGAGAVSQKERLQFKTVIENLKTYSGMLEGSLEKTKKFYEKEFGVLKEKAAARNPGNPQEKEGSFEELLLGLDETSAITEFSPTLLCLKLRKDVKTWKSKCHDLEKKMAGTQAIQKEKVLQIQVKSLKEKLQKQNELLEKKAEKKEEIQTQMAAEKEQNEDNSDTQVRGQDQSFDTAQYKKLVKENQELRTKVGDLTQDLINEKNISQGKILEMEGQVDTTQNLNEQITKVQDLNSNLRDQLALQQNLSDLKLQELKQTEDYLKSENNILKAKIEKVVEGVKLLKSYMYDTLTETEKAEKKTRLADIDKSLVGLSGSLNAVKSGYEAKSATTRTRVLERMDELAAGLAKMEQRTALGVEAEKSRSQIEELKSEILGLKAENKNAKTRIESMSQGLGLVQGQEQGLQLNQNLLKSIDVDRITMALQKSLDLLLVQNKQDKQ